MTDLRTGAGYPQYGMSVCAHLNYPPVYVFMQSCFHTRHINTSCRASFLFAYGINFYSNEQFLHRGNKAAGSAQACHQVGARACHQVKGLPPGESIGDRPEGPAPKWMLHHVHSSISDSTRLSHGDCTLITLP